MGPFHTILFPTDFSDASRAMAADVRQMAARCGAEVTVLHAFDVVPLYYLTAHMDASAGGVSPPMPYAPWASDLRKRAGARLERFCEELAGGTRWRPILEDGEPATMIRSVAERIGADLIMLSTKGSGVFRRLLLGSVAAKVLHDARCAVFTSAHELDPARVRGGGPPLLLCAVEWNPEAETILRSAETLARAWGGTISIVHMAHRLLLGESETAQREFLELVRRLGLPARLRILDADVAAGIRATAIEEGADLVTIGRGKDRGRLSRLWSDVYEIVRESPCPVLSV